MIAYGLPILATLALWWASTGVILRRQSRPAHLQSQHGVGERHSCCFRSGSPAKLRPDDAGRGLCRLRLRPRRLGLAAPELLHRVRHRARAGPPARRIAGGSRASSRPCARACITNWRRILGALALFALTYGQPNQLALWTYLLLWWMHQSAKLNVFFGVPNLGEEMLPDHLAYLASFMRRRPMNPVLPVLGDGLHDCDDAAVRARLARADATAFEIAANTMLATLMALAVAEHWFLVVPIDANAIWRSFQRRPGSDAGRGTAQRVRGGARGDRRAVDGARPAESGTAGIRGAPVFRRSATRATSRRCSISSRPGASARSKAFRGSCARTRIGSRSRPAKAAARMAAFAPQRSHEPRMIARGRRFDRVRLQAALDGAPLVFDRRGIDEQG